MRSVIVSAAVVNISVFGDAVISDGFSYSVVVHPKEGFLKQLVIVVDARVDDGNINLLIFGKVKRGKIFPCARQIESVFGKIPIVLLAQSFRDVGVGIRAGKRHSDSGKNHCRRHNEQYRKKD